MSLLLLGVAVALLAGVLVRADPGGRRRASLAILLAVYIAPALFLTYVFFTAGDSASQFRFALLGVGFRGEPEREFSISIGGNRERDDVWVSALAGGPSDSALGRFVFTPPSTDVVGQVSFIRPSASDLSGSGSGSGLLGLRPAGESLRPWRAVELIDGDRVAVDERTWEVDFDTGWLGPPASLRKASGQDEAGQIDLPVRVGRLPLGIPLRILRPLPSVLETYPLGWLEKSAGARATTSSFLYWQPEGFLGRRLWLAVSDEKTSVERDGAPLSIESPSLTRGGSVHVLSPPRWSGNRFAAGGIRDRRSFRLKPGRRSFALQYDSPEIHVLSPRALSELALSEPVLSEPVPSDVQGADDVQDADDSVRLHLSMGGWQVTDKSLYFRHTSRPVALEALATLEIPRQFLTGESAQADSRFVTATPRGQRQGRLGVPLWLGGEKLAAIQIDLLTPPKKLALFALLLAVLKAFAARAGRLSHTHLLLAAPLEALVTFRLLLGYRAWALPPFEQEALELALVAWALLPWGFLIASAAVGEALDLLPALGGCLFALSWCWIFAGGGMRSWVWALCLVLAFGLWWARRLGWMERWGERLDEGMDAAMAASPRRVLLLWTLLAFVPTLARIALLFLGNRESLQIGSQRFALSLIHVPLALLLEAVCLLWLWRQISERRELRFVDLVPASAVVVGTWLMPALFAGDLGLALLNLPVFLLALSAVALAAGARLVQDGVIDEHPLARERWVAWAPSVVLVLFLVFAAFPIGARLLLAALPAQAELALESERNYLRLLAFAYPKRLEEVARQSSEELTVMSAVMRSYTSGPFTGRGYFASELSPHISATALREHVPSVFVAAEWGLAGILGLLALFASLGLAGRACSAWRFERREGFPASGAGGFWGTVALLAGLTLAVPSVYMLLANYRLTLFTGKNVYLLGVDSTADVLEVFLLTLLFALGASVLRDEEEV